MCLFETESGAGKIAEPIVGGGEVVEHVRGRGRRIELFLVTRSGRFEIPLFESGVERGGNLRCDRSQRQNGEGEEGYPFEQVHQAAAEFLRQYNRGAFTADRFEALRFEGVEKACQLRVVEFPGHFGSPRARREVKGFRQVGNRFFAEHRGDVAVATELPEQLREFFPEGCTPGELRIMFQPFPPPAAPFDQNRRERAAEQKEQNPADPVADQRQGHAGTRCRLEVEELFARSGDLLHLRFGHCGACRFRGRGAVGDCRGEFPFALDNREFQVEIVPDILSRRRAERGEFQRDVFFARLERNDGIFEFNQTAVVRRTFLHFAGVDAESGQLEFRRGERLRCALSPGGDAQREGLAHFAGVLVESAGDLPVADQSEVDAVRGSGRQGFDGDFRPRFEGYPVGDAVLSREKGIEEIVVER